MPPIRVVISSLPKLLRDIVASALSGAPDLELVGEAPEPGELRQLVREWGADVAVVACERAAIPRVGNLINGSPVALLAITDEGRRGTLYELRPQEIDLGELSPEVLLNAIRATGSKDVA